MEKFCDVTAERAVLAGIFQYGNDAYLDIADLVNSNTFGVDTNSVIFKVFQHGLEKSESGKLDLATVMASANEIGVKWLLDNENRQILRAIINLPVELANVRRMAGKIGRLAQAKTLGKTLDEIKVNLAKVTGDEPMSHILGIVEKPIIDYSLFLNTTQDNEPKLIGEGLSGFLDQIETNPIEQPGLSTGYKVFDKAIGGGLRRKTVNVIGARPKQGKTVLAASISTYIAGILGVPVLMLDTEMAKEDQWVRLLAKFSKVKIDEIETGKYSKDPEKKLRVRQAAAFLEKSPFSYLSIAGMPFEETISTMRRWVMKNVGFYDNGRAKDCLIVFDYLKLMSSEGLNDSLKEYQALGFMMTGLHNFVHRHDVPCLSFVQLNRDGIDEESAGVVSQSDRIVWLCSNFSIYKKKSDEEFASEMSSGYPNIGTHKLIPIVARHGGGLEDKDYISFRFEKQYANVEEVGSWLEIKSGNSNDFKIKNEKDDVTF